jgi:acetyl-CoA decarbonylase/synthase complex subunit gamma
MKGITGAMGLTGLEIYKQLPKKNCGECGPPTCLAFAMNLASGKASLDSCPYVTDEARAVLASASAPPIAKITIGNGTAAYELGGETELFRHDKKFYQETAIAVQLDDNDHALEEKISAIANQSWQRVGLEYKTQFIAIKNTSGDQGSFVKAVEVASLSGKPLVLISDDVENMAAALDVAGLQKPLLYAANNLNYEKMTGLAKTNNCPLAVVANGLDALSELVEKIVALGHKQLVLDPGVRETSKAIAHFTQIRRLAITKRFRNFGYPLIAFTTESDPLAEAVQAANFIAKYASLVVIKTFASEQLLPLLTWRQNLYTDPQVPIKVEQKLHAIGAVNAESPVYVTTNFSLTYFLVEGEVETSRIPSYIISVDTDGLSVLTAYADGKFDADKIAIVMKKLEVEGKVSHRKLIIPGSVAVLKGKLEEVTGWSVIVGPREASGIVPFAKNQFAS